MLTSLYTIKSYDPSARMALALRPSGYVLLIDKEVDVYDLNVARQTYIIHGVTDYELVRNLDAFVRECGWTEFKTPPEEAGAVEWLNSAAAATRLGIPVKRLRSMAREAPGELPGAPQSVGDGVSRQHLRWPRAQLQDWLVAYQEWKAVPPRAARSRRARPRASPTRSNDPVDWNDLRDELLDD
jgi:hypothetical protein